MRFFQGWISNEKVEWESVARNHSLEIGIERALGVVEEAGNYQLLFAKGD